MSSSRPPEHAGVVYPGFLPACRRREGDRIEETAALQAAAVQIDLAVPGRERESAHSALAQRMLDLNLAEAAAVRVVVDLIGRGFRFSSQKHHAGNIIAVVVERGAARGQQSGGVGGENDCWRCGCIEHSYTRPEATPDHRRRRLRQRSRTRSSRTCRRSVPDWAEGRRHEAPAREIGRAEKVFL